MELEIKKSKKSKYARVRIKPNGLVLLTVPNYFNDSDISDVYQKFLPWIEKHYDKAKDKSLDKLIEDNGYIYILGNKVIIHLYLDNKDYIEYGDELNIYYTKIEKVTKTLNKFINDLAKKVFNEIIIKYEDITNLKINELKIKKMSSAYGRCNKTKKEIVLSIYNIHKRIEFIEAVIVHELCHLVECNHKKAFYDLVYKYYPNYKDEIKKKVNE